jgi:hypothetical protein
MAALTASLAEFTGGCSEQLCIGPPSLSRHRQGDATHRLAWPLDGPLNRKFQQHLPIPFHPRVSRLSAKTRRASRDNARAVQLPDELQRLLDSRLYHPDQIANSPRGICDACGHCWRATNGTVEFHEVVIPVMECDRCLEVFKLLGERIRQPAQAAAMHPQRMILLLDIAGAP